MRLQLLLSLFLFLFHNNIIYSQCGDSIRLFNWQAVGSTDANWAVATDGKSVRQTINAGSTGFISPDTLFNVRLAGTFRSDDSDDDWMGFYFGYRGVAPNHQTYLFDWKQKNQGTWPGGFSLWGLNGSFGPDPNHRSNPPDQILIDSNFTSPRGMNGYGWQRGVDHQFIAEYKSAETIIIIDQDTIFITQACFNPGRFGFHNNSQANCTYANFNFEILADFFIEDDTICLSDSANFNIFCDEVAPNYYDSIVWDFGDGSPLNIGTNYNIKHKYAQAGVYHVNLFLRHRNSGCTAVATKEIVVTSPPIFTLGNDTAICRGEMLTLSATPNSSTNITSYNWWNGSNLMNETVSTNGNYYLDIIDQFGCETTDSFL